MTDFEERERTGKTDLSGWFERVANADDINLTVAQVQAAATKDLTGRAAEQVDTFLKDELDPVLAGIETAAAEGLRV
jgi:hypothetical protein